MKAKIVVIFLFVCACITGCNRIPCKDGLSYLPMYGEEKKCDKQIETDNQFLEDCDKQYSSRKEACEAMLRFAQKHYVNGDLNLAMERFNQAWLLDSLNANVYLGFGEVLIDQGKFEESLRHFDKAIQLNPEKAEAYKYSGLANESLFDETSDQKYLDKSIEQLKRAVVLNPSDGSSYALLTISYSHFPQQDSARKYLQIADRLKSGLISDETREQILKGGNQ